MNTGRRKMHWRPKFGNAYYERQPEAPYGYGDKAPWGHSEDEWCPWAEESYLWGEEQESLYVRGIFYQNGYVQTDVLKRWREHRCSRQEQESLCYRGAFYQNSKVQSDVMKRWQKRRESTDYLPLQESAIEALPISHWQPSLDAVKRKPISLQIKSGQVFNLQSKSLMADSELKHILCDLERRVPFRQFAGRAIVDVKLRGTATMPALSGPYESLNSLLKVVVQLAQHSLRNVEELALVQLIVNHYKDGESEVKPHTHRCRQICVSLGAPREVNVEGLVLQMRNGDCLPLAGELHSVPRAKGVSESRISVCLFYGSSEEFSSGALRVNSSDGKFGNSHWWVHPKDLYATATEAEPGFTDCAVKSTPSGRATSKMSSNAVAPSKAFYSNLGVADTPWSEAADAWTYGAAAWRHNKPVVIRRAWKKNIPVKLRTQVSEVSYAPDGT